MAPHAKNADNDASFPRLARLLTPAAFRGVFSGGRRISGRHFQLIVVTRQADQAAESQEQAQADVSMARLGLTVAKRVAKRAVDRNRIKRIARESFRHQRGNLSGLDLVLVARAGAAELTCDELKQAFASLWERAEPLKPGDNGVTLLPEKMPVTPTPSSPSH